MENALLLKRERGCGIETAENINKAAREREALNVSIEFSFSILLYNNLRIACLWFFSLIEKNNNTYSHHSFSFPQLLPEPPHLPNSLFFLSFSLLKNKNKNTHKKFTHKKKTHKNSKPETKIYKQKINKN